MIIIRMIKCYDIWSVVIEVEICYGVCNYSSVDTLWPLKWKALKYIVNFLLYKLDWFCVVGYVIFWKGVYLSVSVGFNTADLGLK